jgi:DNA repair protein RadA/Sms
MARSSSIHVCSQCAHEEPRWHGRCPGCGEWNTMVEQDAATGAAATRAGGAGLGAGRRAPRALKPTRLADVLAPAVARLSTGIGELDRVLGGGIVPGSVVLLGGARESASRP